MQEDCAEFLDLFRNSSHGPLPDYRVGLLEGERVRTLVMRTEWFHIFSLRTLFQQSLCRL